MKRDGHTHTQFCRHGSGEDAELFVQEAIRLGIEVYSFTEHAPLPEGVAQICAQADEAIYECNMLMSDLRPYLNEMNRLKRKYAGHIELLVGLEVDFIEGYEKEIKDFLDEYGGHLEDSILSVHLDPPYMIDYNPETTGILIDKYGSVHNFEKRYFDLLKKSVEADLGRYRPHRIGHPSLCRKFRKNFSREDQDRFLEDTGTWENLVRATHSQDYWMDLNYAGLRKIDCGEVYPPKVLEESARSLGMGFVFGSDAHAVRDLRIAHLN